MPPFSGYNVSLESNYPLEQSEPCLAPSKGPLADSHARKPRKSVSFNERVRAKKTIHFADFSEQETSAYWYSDDDFIRMKQDVHFEVNLLENECLQQDTSNYCRRGLEYYTSDGAKRRSSNKRKSRNVVFEEQKLQRSEGSNDQDYIAEIYAAVVAPSRALASQVAVQDHLDAHQ